MVCIVFISITRVDVDITVIHVLLNLCNMGTLLEKSGIPVQIRCLKLQNMTFIFVGLCNVCLYEKIFFAPLDF